MKFTLLTATVLAAVTGLVSARDCTAGLHYCGDILHAIDDGYYSIVRQSLFDARKPIGEENNSLFMCIDEGGYHGYLRYEKYCGQGRCRDGGGGKDDYCL